MSDTSKIDPVTLNLPAGNFYFTSGDKNALRPDLGDRRFSVVAHDAAIHAGEVVDPNWPYSGARKPYPVAWIIERDGRVAMIHYEACAVKAEADGYIVTPYYSRVK